jgi:hypothetical protein
MVACDILGKLHLQRVHTTIPRVLRRDLCAHVRSSTRFSGAAITGRGGRLHGEWSYIVPLGTIRVVAVANILKTELKLTAMKGGNLNLDVNEFAHCIGGDQARIAETEGSTSGSSDVCFGETLRRAAC